VIVAHKPFYRGVTQLMYVGDVPVANGAGAGVLEEALPVAVLAAVAYKTKGALRLASGLGAAYLALKKLGYT
jgi:hypothetical protein